jgi:peptidylprolyl isomerase
VKNNKLKFGWVLAALVLIVVLAACQPAVPEFEGTDGQIAPTSDAEIIANENPEEQVAVDVNDLIAPAEEAVIEPIVWDDAITTDSGLQYIVVTPGEGESPQIGDMVSMHFIASLPDGSTIADSYSSGQPSLAILGREQLLPGWEEGVLLMKTGEKMQMLLPPELAFGEAGYGMIPANSQLVIEVELLSVEPTPSPMAVDENDLVTTDSGLQYYDIEAGEGDESVIGSTVTTNYALWVQGEDEDLFIGSSDAGGPATFSLGPADLVFPGWDEGATGMKVGGKRLLIIPAELGLGEAGAGDIPPGSTLIMEIEMVNIIEPVFMTEVDEDDYSVTESGLKYFDLVEGQGDSPAEGQTVVVHYTGWLEDGTKFDSSLDRGQPFTFPLGQGAVIPGWDEGVSTMKIGGKRQLVIPPELGYGEAGAGASIPPGATLIFEVELLDLQ